MSRVARSFALVGAVFAGVELPNVRAPSALHAATISFQISGTMSSVDHGGAPVGDFYLAPDVVVGAPFTGVLTYNLVPPPQGSTSRATYKYAPTTGSMGLTVTVGSQTFTTNLLGGFSILMTNAVLDDPMSQVDQFFFSSSWHDPVGTFTDNMIVSLVDHSGSVFPNPSLPAMLNVDDFDFREFQVVRSSSAVTRVYPPQAGTFYALGGSIDTIALVPEPSTVVLAALGLLAWLVILRRPRLRPRRSG